jgi:hypothetical protein
VCDASLLTPKCKNCYPGWMGEACENICDATHGAQTPMNSGFCECDTCYTGKGCNVECDGHGTCNNGTCTCKVGWRGSKCEVPGCPGNETDCTHHGVCNTALHECTCLPGKWIFMFGSAYIRSKVRVETSIINLAFYFDPFQDWSQLQPVKCFRFESSLRS